MAACGCHDAMFKKIQYSGSQADYVRICEIVRSDIAAKELPALGDFMQRTEGEKFKRVSDLVKRKKSSKESCILILVMCFHIFVCNHHFYAASRYELRSKAMKDKKDAEIEARDNAFRAWVKSALPEFDIDKLSVPGF